jgi:hypothetical protein
MDIEQNEITINGKVYVLKGSEQKGTEQKDDIKGDIKICILQRGWVMIGRLEKNGSDCTLHNASVIRRWGTTKGLGELVNGPTKDTALDKCYGEVQFDSLTVVATISCKGDVWENKL